MALRPAGQWKTFFGEPHATLTSLLETEKGNHSAAIHGFFCSCSAENAFLAGDTNASLIALHAYTVACAGFHRASATLAPVLAAMTL